MAQHKRIKKAIELAVKYGGIDGDHHKAWVIDQMVMALAGCPVKEFEAKTNSGVPYKYKAMVENDEYKKLLLMPVMEKMDPTLTIGRKESHLETH